MMANGIEMHNNRMTAYELYREACSECCIFVMHFLELRNLNRSISDIRTLHNKLGRIIKKIDELEIGDA